MVRELLRSIIPFYFSGPTFRIYKCSHLRALLHPDVLIPTSKFSLHFHERFDFFPIYVHDNPVNLRLIQSPSVRVISLEHLEGFAIQTNTASGSEDTG